MLVWYRTPWGWSEEGRNISEYYWIICASVFLYLCIYWYSTLKLCWMFHTRECRCRMVTSCTPVDCRVISRFGDFWIKWLSKLSVGLLSAFIFFGFVVLVIRCHRSEQSCGTLMPRITELWIPWLLVTLSKMQDRSLPPFTALKVTWGGQLYCW